MFVITIHGTLELLSVIMASVSQCYTFRIPKLCILNKEYLMLLLISLSGKVIASLLKQHMYYVMSVCMLFLTCRQILPKEVSEYVSGALAYSAIVSVCASTNNTDSELKRKFLNTNGSIDVSYPLLLFPCRTV